jgi:succinate dehydrogenase/fumarate reductase flavoprotein subunit
MSKNNLVYEEKKEKWDEVADIIVIGSGFAGLSAAIEARNAGLGINYPELVRVVAEKANDAFEWSSDYLGVEYIDRVDVFGGHSVPRCYTAKNISGATIIKKQVEKLEAQDVKVRLGMCFKSFIQDLNKRVCGVIVRMGYDYKNPDQGTDIKIKAEKGVILAAGQLP